MDQKLRKIIEEMQANSASFHEQVAGDALATLQRMYLDDMSIDDVDKVITCLQGFVSEMKKED